MKCSSIKLSSRLEHTGRNVWNEENTTPRFTCEEPHRCHLAVFVEMLNPETYYCSYSFPFLRRKSGKPEKPTSLAITNILPPDNFQGFNTGCSLEKWSQKRTRLKSAKVAKSPTEDDKDFCYETLETDLSILLNEPEELCRSHDGSLSNLHYEVHSDIEQLLLKNERSQEEEEEDSKGKTKNHHKKRGKKKKGKKAIKFSISKPPSPETELVIRVDVTSNAITEECRRAESPDNCSKEMIDDKRKELKRNLNESGEMCDEDFIVRCRQLALRQRRRRL